MPISAPPSFEQYIDISGATTLSFKRMYDGVLFGTSTLTIYISPLPMGTPIAVYTEQDPGIATTWNTVTVDLTSYGFTGWGLLNFEEGDNTHSSQAEGLGYLYLREVKLWNSNSSKTVSTGRSTMTFHQDRSGIGQPTPGGMDPWGP